ncbi:hypothetical protein XA68_14782 [Ophiocordyceps unilateralis]|uniref:Uncharacterized protein n=1 Tax=Ophiocordyceps unilateralis TaxID=268505 RepID=A0A2A9P862_OPHUN|nr:hypothetical protein XA68_14782 [Ophiocordyceps unilateralis]
MSPPSSSPPSSAPLQVADSDPAPCPVPNPLASPNAIPPRTSSTGLHSRSGHSNSLSHSGSTPSVLRPVSEADWLGQKRPPNAVSSSSTNTNWLSPALDSFPGAAMQQQHPRPPSPPTAAPNPERYAHDDLQFTPDRSWTEGKERVIRAPFEYAISHPGKDFRSQVISAFNVWLQVPPESLQVITKVIGMLHESSLLLDDVQDSSELRRGFPVAHSIFGIAQTINAAHYISFVALRELQQLNSPRAISVFADELVNLFRGQGMDLFWRDTLTCPSEDDYLEMVANKTGGIFRLGIKLMQAESTATIDCVPLTNLIGLIFQIRDDYLNLSSTEYTKNKGICEDLTEGKFSFPIIHSIRSDPGNLQLVSILKQKTTDVQVKRYAVSYMEGTGSFAYTRRVITTLIERARKIVLDLDAGQGKADGLLAILDKMAVE